MKKITVFLMLLFSTITMTSQTKVGDVMLPNTMAYSGQKLVLNGAGIREKLFFDIYSAGLYLQTKTSKASTIMNTDESMGIRLHITSSLMSTSKMRGALHDGFEKSTNGNMTPFNTRIKEFTALMDGEVKVGNIYDMVYIKGKGTEVYKMGKKQGIIKGLDFKKALFGIWLSNNPADKGLKKDLLGN